MTNQHFQLNFATTEVYECGAILVALLAYPEDLNDVDRPSVHASLCAQYLRERYVKSEDEAIPVTMKPMHALRTEKQIKKDLKTLGRRMRDRMIAARIAMGFLQEAAGHTPKLPKGVNRLSLNQMSALVSDEAGESDPSNTETRVWRRSVPVVHLAAATAISLNNAGRAGSPRTSVGDILHSRSIIEEIIVFAKYFEFLLENSRLSIDPAKLVKVRLA